MSKCDASLMWSPKCNVPLRYLKIHFTHCQCNRVGADKYWLNLFTAKEISGLVLVKYYRAPIAERNKVAFFMGSPVLAVMIFPVVIGDGQEEASDMSNFCSKSVIYLA